MKVFLFFAILVTGVKSTAAEIIVAGKAGAQMHRYFAVCTQGKADCTDGQCAFKAEKVKCKKPLAGAKTDADQVSCDFKCAGHSRHLTGAPALFLIEQIPQLAEGKVKPQAPSIKNGSAGVIEGN